MGIPGGGVIGGGKSPTRDGIPGGGCKGVGLVFEEENAAKPLPWIMIDDGDPSFFSSKDSASKPGGPTRPPFVCGRISFDNPGGLGVVEGTSLGVVGITDDFSSVNSSGSSVSGREPPF